MWYHIKMPSVVKILAKMQENPRGIAYTELMKVCEHSSGSLGAPVDHMQCSRPLGLEILASTSRMTTGGQSRIR